MGLELAVSGQERGYVPGMYSMICPRLELLEGPMAVLLWYRIEPEEGASCSCGVQGARCSEGAEPGARKDTSVQRGSALGRISRRESSAHVCGAQWRGSVVC